MNKILRLAAVAAAQLVESCIVEDASKLRRPFPFSFIALPWESDLND